MSIYTLESATAFGALDYDAMVDGRALDANVARTMVRQSNRLIRKRHQLLNLVWPMRLDDGEYRVEMVGAMYDEALLAPLTIKKKPGLTAADVYLRVHAPSGRQVRYSFGTRGQPDYTQQSVLHTGTGSWANVTRALTLDAGPVETLQVYYRAEGEGALMNTATYGGPNSDDLEDYALTETCLNSVSAPRPNWNEEAIARAGHYIRVLVRGQPVASSRILHGNSGTNRDHALHYDRLSTGYGRSAVGGIFGRLLPDQLAIDVGFDPDPAQNVWEIRELAWFGLAHLLVVAQERAL
jgi:hypothetical protein